MNNSQVRRDRADEKATTVNEENTVRPERRGLRTKCHPVDEAIPSEVTEMIKNSVPGVVTDCLRLNVRDEASEDAEIVTIIDALSEVMVDIANSTDKFYKVCTAAGVEGFCMKKYIALRR